MTRKKRGAVLGLAAALLLLVLFYAPTLPEPLTDPQRGISLKLTDRNGLPLRDVLSTMEGVAHWRKLSEISPYLLAATVISEDQRFYAHPGVDPLAMLRALRQDVLQKQVVQGGSTLTQQLVRNLLAPRERGWRTKLSEAFWALRLERRYSKAQILEFYLNRIPYGSQCYGVEAACQFYFAKSAQELSCAQAAFLAILPRAPESFLPYQEPEEIVTLQRQLLKRMLDARAISSEQYELALQEPLELKPAAGYFEAGHFCDYVLSQGVPLRGDVRTTLDLPLNQDVELILRNQIKHLGHLGVNNGAVVILDVFNGDILAMVGSTDYQNSQFNGATSGRQPGSALKPFTYALALERDKTASSLLPDLDLYPHQMENGYIPRNYDDKFHGPVRLRTALACSYNVPVVRVLEEMGTEALLSLLHNLGFARLTQTPEHYGLGLTLGDGEVTLLEIASAYRCLARAGHYAPPRCLPETSGPADKAVLDPRVAWIITNILKDPLERIPAFGISTPLNLPFEVAAKTGTSKSYRDNWTVGYSSHYVVAVWVGNLDGASMHGVSGITGAGPVFHECFLSLERRDHGSPRFPGPPAGVVQADICPASGDLAGPDCPGTVKEWFLSERQPTGVCSVHRRIGSRVYLDYPPLYRGWMVKQGLPLLPPLHNSRVGAVSIAFPDGNSTFRSDPVLRADHQQIHFRGVVPSTTASVEWWIDDHSQPSNRNPFDCWWSMKAGLHQAVLVAHDAHGVELGRSEPIRFTVK